MCPRRATRGSRRSRTCALTTPTGRRRTWRRRCWRGWEGSRSSLGVVTSTSDVFGLLLDTRTWLALDLEADGRLLAGHDDLGSLQLVEIAADGTATPLTDLPSKCRGRYVPGRRQIVVEHDQGGDENFQLSLLDLTEPPESPVGGGARQGGRGDLPAPPARPPGPAGVAGGPGGSRAAGARRRVHARAARRPRALGRLLPQPPQRRGHGRRGARPRLGRGTRRL